MFSTKSQHAGVAFSELEKKLIVEGIAEFLPILSLPGSHQSTYRRKTAKWDEIRDRCSKVYPFLTRPTKAIKKKWGQMHYKAKQKKVAGLTEMDRAVLALYEQISVLKTFL